MSPDDPTTPQATPQQLVVEMVAALRTAETDEAVLDILAAHIVTIAPGEDAVHDACSAIEALAAKRAE